MSKERVSWDLANSLPVGLVLGLITQGAAIVWTVSMMMADIESNRKDITETQIRVGRLETSVQNQAVSMARIDENIKAIRMSVEKMAEK
jgi:septal ring factor EnvC (AmiA/AmiB activator)|tara:strand:+ start:903 stop:1169 length:267 start_codon:yes stop_codon:yes gene_type:complete